MRGREEKIINPRRLNSRGKISDLHNFNLLYEKNIFYLIKYERNALFKWSINFHRNIYELPVLLMEIDLNIFTWKSQDDVLNAPPIPFNSRPSFLIRGNNFH